MRLLPLAVMIMSCQYFAYAQSSSMLIGARAAGMGYASSCLSDEWAIFNNIGALARLENIKTGFTYDAQPSFAPFNKAAAVVTVPLSIGVAGIGIYRFGDKLYNEQVFSTGFSSTFGLASLGLKVNYIQYNVDGFGRKGVFSVSLGGVAELTPQLFVGAHIVNINQPELSTLDDERLPTLLIAGILFKASDKVILSTELEKDLDYPLTWKTGMECVIQKKFIARTGFNVSPAAGFLGLGFKPRKFTLDYSYQYRFNHGARHQATVGYKFNSQKK